MKMLSLAALALATPLLASATAAGEFPRNAMIVSSDDSPSPSTGSVRLLDSAGAPLELIINLANPVDAMVGPDGRMYVVSSGDDRVRVVAQNEFGGSIEAILGAGSDLTALGFGPQGSLFVTSRGDDLVYQFALDGLLLSTIGTGSPLIDPADLTFGPDGNMFVASEPAGRVHEFSPHGDYLGEIGSLAQSEASGVAFGPTGEVYVSSGADDRVFVYDAQGAEVAQIGVGSGLSQPAGLTFGPDGMLHVVSRGDDKVYVFDASGVLQRTVAPLAVLDMNPSIDFVPHRLPLSGRSKIYFDDQETERSKVFGTVSVQPGSNRIMLHMPEANELKDAFGDEIVVFYGFEAYSNDPKVGRKREYHGQCIASDAVQDGVGSVAMELRGKISKSDGFFSISSARCMLVRSDDGASTFGKMRLKKPIN